MATMAVALDRNLFFGILQLSNGASEYITLVINVLKVFKTSAVLNILKRCFGVVRMLVYGILILHTAYTWWCFGGWWITSSNLLRLRRMSFCNKRLKLYGNLTTISAITTKSDKT